MNKKTILLSLTTLVLGGMVLTPKTAEAYRGDLSVTGPNYTVERHQTMLKAFANKDYQSWNNLMQNRGRVTQVGNEANFAKFVQAHELSLQGKTAEANLIRQELGLGLQNGSGMGRNRSR